MSAQILSKLKALKLASRELRTSDTQKRNLVLTKLADLLKENESVILSANQKDIKALGKSTTPAFRDRLELNPKRIAEMIESLKQVAALPDPVSELVEKQTLSNGLILKKIRAPLGVVFMIFESRPNVATEAFSLALKSGNVMILRGGKESLKTVSELYKLMTQALEHAGFSKNTFWGITNPDRKITSFLLKARTLIDIVVPRGGDGLIEFVVKNSEIPIIKNDRGLCHVYVHDDADLDMALKIVKNSKTHRPGVCNAAETLLVHESRAAEFLPMAYDEMAPLDVEWFCDAPSFKILKSKKLVRKAKPSNFDTEYLDFKINCKIVKDLDETIEHIDTHGSHHSESIVTKSEPAARKFQNEIDSAAVYWNASTRFTDGFEFGLGGELGISTQKLHVRGPVGLRELTSPRWVIDGTGQIRS